MGSPRPSRAASGDDALPGGRVFALASLRRVLDNSQHSGETLDVVPIRFDEWEDVTGPTATLPLIEDVEPETAA